jgi:hypothetical protein
LNIAQEELIKIATSEDSDAHLDLELSSWLDNSGAWLELDHCALRVILLIPSEVSWQITKVGQNQAHLLMLRLGVDVFLDTCVDTAEVHDSSVKAYHRSLNL